MAKQLGAFHKDAPNFSTVSVPI